ncbi:hypothetical protein JNB62_15395 [Microbacterium jejuense]|uniref:DUF3618 domain-containing protein n=1 Tax=Microbacterium jejuense TaxID=1263637 RepID=A0ABS7HQ27_9MICO|nr:hypothetical protein [Microbacterium jejuense]MBW9095072.1 hypothetical protein [Microbacterium jejuense]
MSSEAPVPVPRTAVPLGIADPVEQARAELKAALAAIEEKANVPRRVGRAVDERVAQARAFQRRNPTMAAVAVVVGAVAIGAAVWGAVRLYTR